LRAAEDALELAGSGSNLPLTRRLLEAWRRRTGHHFILHSSIGTTGGVQAVRDGAVHVGLLSRPLHAHELAETERDFERIAYAWSVVVLAANPSVPDRDIATTELLDLLRGRPSWWSDGSARVIMLRERGDSSHRVAILRIPGFREAEHEAQIYGRFRVLYSDVELRYALLGTPGAVGFTDLGAGAIDGLPLHPLSIDGVEPTLDNARAGRYRLVKPLLLLVPRARDERTESFVRYLRSPDARALIESSGFLATEPIGGVP
jgi:phosphate transport system substrate-binding protein